MSKHITEDIKIRTYKSGDEEQIIELLELVFQGWPHFDLNCPPIDHWIWKFKDNPSRTNLIIVGEIDDRIIGCDHSFFTRIKVGSSIMLCRQGLDAAIHPDFRGIGIYSRIFKMKDELDSKLNIGLTYGATSNQILIKRGSRTNLPIFPYPVIIITRINDINLHMRKNNIRGLWKKYAFHAVRILNKIEVYLTSSPKKPQSRIEISEVDKFDGQIDIFWSKIKNDYNFITERSSEYLNWRYCDPRGGGYIIKQAKEDDEIIGYIVLRVNNYDKDYPEGYIVDLCTLQGRLYCAETLIAESMRYFKEQKVNVIYYCIVKGHSYLKLFIKYGFLNFTNKIHINYTPNKIGGDLEVFKNSSSEKILFQYNDLDWC